MNLPNPPVYYLVIKKYDKEVERRQAYINHTPRVGETIKLFSNSIGDLELKVVGVSSVLIDDAKDHPITEKDTEIITEIVPKSKR
ncbi:hypothetical protein HYT23_01995 [Candidatus Pacearchaeota archaeon]|nr:hypothetical protein [Candidatus Pacearchaeota archaeon]